MLTNFTIRNYKSIKELALPDLKRINLLIGRNNAGKSNILEALLLYATRFSYESIVQLNTQNENKLLLALENQFDFRKLVLPLVTNQSVNILKRGIMLQSNQNKISLQNMKVRKIHHRNGEVSITCENFKEEDDSINGVPKIVYYTSRGGIRWRNIIHNSQTQEITPCIYLNCSKKQIDDVNHLWSTIGLTDQKEELLKALKLIDPDIQDVAMLYNSLINDYAPYVRIHNEIQPLYSMGDGISHIFNVILSLLRVKNGILLLDELENGLHYKALKELWEIINRLSQELNVQVFVTTHSHDCIKSYNEIVREEGILYCISRKENTLYKSFSYEEIDGFLAANMEIRDSEVYPEED